MGPAPTNDNPEDHPNLTLAIAWSINPQYTLSFILEFYRTQLSSVSILRRFTVMLNVLVLFGVSHSSHDISGTDTLTGSSIKAQSQEYTVIHTNRSILLSQLTVFPAGSL